MEDCERAIRVLPDLDRSLDEVMSDRTLRQLQSEPREGGSIVAGNDTLFLDAQDLGQNGRIGGDEGAVLDRGRLGKRAL